MFCRRTALLRIVVATWTAAAVLVGLAPAAAAHAELVQASPRVDSTVGGEFHAVALLFAGLDEAAPFRAELLDPAGRSIGAPAVTDDGRVVIPVDPLAVPGVYTVSYTVTGVDSDITSSVFSFRFDPSAAPPPGIDLELTSVARFNWFDYLLILAAAAMAGFLVHRVRMAWRLGRPQPEQAV